MAGQPKKRRVLKGAKGHISRVPCPWCKRTNDFRGMAGTGGDAHAFGAYGLESGTVVDCDHCKRKMRITGVHTITAISVVPTR